MTLEAEHQRDIREEEERVLERTYVRTNEHISTNTFRFELSNTELKLVLVWLSPTKQPQFLTERVRHRAYFLTCALRCAEKFLTPPYRKLRTFSRGL